jgi:hypothetical protein
LVRSLKDLEANLLKKKKKKKTKNIMFGIEEVEGEERKVKASKVARYY